MTIRRIATLSLVILAIALASPLEASVSARTATLSPCGGEGTAKSYRSPIGAQWVEHRAHMPAGLHHTDG